jgi:acyl-CoA hydrolase
MELSSASAVRVGATRKGTLSDLVRLFSPGERVFLPGSAGEIPPLVDELCDQGAPPLSITASFVPGINPVPFEHFPAATSFTSIFMQAGAPGAQARGQVRHLPLSYGSFVVHLRTLSFDSCVVHVTPPDQDGRCSLGAAVEFTPVAATRSKRILAVINPLMPRIPQAASIALTDFEFVAETEAPLREYDVGSPSDQAMHIARHIAPFVQDNSTLQIGLGKVPDALLRMLTDRRGLRLHSGMLSDGTRALVESNSLDPNWVHTSCVHVGTKSYYEWLSGRSDFAVRSCDYTHDLGVLLQLPRLVAVNSALAVDLFGQANLEMLNGHMVSGVGGAADFARAASLSVDGISIVALPSVSRGGEVSRIVPQLEGICSIPRNDIDVVITENGAADLRNCSVVERAEKLISIAAPQHQEMLVTAFREIGRKL